MVSIIETEHVIQIILKPNCSMTWKGNQRLIFSLMILSACISGGFALIGAWVILPFAGLEITLLSIALYYVSWKLSYLHVINLWKEKVVVEKGFRYPKQTWTLARDSLVIFREDPCHDMDGPALFLRIDREDVAIGEFLNKQDRETLLSQLVKQNIVVRPHRMNSAFV